MLASSPLGTQPSRAARNNATTNGSSMSPNTAPAMNRSRPRKSRSRHLGRAQPASDPIGLCNGSASFTTRTSRLLRGKQPHLDLLVTVGSDDGGARQPEELE